MRRNSSVMIGVAIIGAFALSACNLMGGGDDKGGDSSNNASDGGSGGDGGGGNGSGSGAGGAKPSDEGAGGGSSGGDSGQGGGQGGGQTGDQSGGERAGPTGGQAGGGGGMQEVGDIVEGFTGQLDGYLDNYEQNLAQGFGNAGVRDVITGLQAGNEYRWNLGTLRGGQTYRILGACDQDCTDVDLIVEDENGIEVGRDVALDDHPVVTITPRHDGPFSVRIGLVNCEIEPCYVAGRVLQQGR